MKMDLRTIGVGLLLVNLYACRVLSKSETASVASLAKAIDASATMPADFAKQYYGVLLDSKQALIAPVTDPVEKVTQLKELLDFRKLADSVVAHYTAGYGILKKYAQLMLAITDTSYLKELAKQKEAFTPALDSLVAKYNTYNKGQDLPVKSLGDLAAALIDKVGGRRLGYLQRKFLKGLVRDADTAIAQICDNYKKFDFYKNEKFISDLETTLDENYKKFLKLANTTSQDKVMNDLKVYDPLYLDWKNKEAALQEFNKQSQASIDKLRKAHAKLKQALDKNASFKDFVFNLKDLYGSVNSLSDSYKKFQKDFSLLKSN